MGSVGEVSKVEVAEEEKKGSKENGNKKKRKIIFQYGNYNRYYGYRVGSTLEEDPRMSLMRKSWFEDKDVIDVGCNEGHVTISLVQKYRVRSMCGLDIDPGLIHKAWKNLENEAGVTEGRTVKSLYQWSDYVYEEGMDWLDCDDEDFEKPALTGTSAETTIDDKMEGGLEGMELLERVIFKNANVLHCNLRSNIVDTVLCLSVVKWIHLNWGDEGLLEFFIMTYRTLRPGGAFILEPQPWSSYERKCRVSEVCRQNFRNMILRPDHFPGILLEQIGFKSCEEISLEVPNSTKGFSRPLYLFTK
ncbi:hypothetical protein KC19_2G163300 [Ceratodon purpureus]|uniref:RNA methyltransferase n=1 Tax=Ceratodon purpureus TaxID=3225 RepID=A0A8T0IWD7_CERPU|nr:hypothetical protein KC19_2G163300 [Ceratodon purpureus]